MLKKIIFTICTVMIMGCGKESQDVPAFSQEAPRLSLRESQIDSTGESLVTYTVALNNDSMRLINNSQGWFRLEQIGNRNASFRLVSISVGNKQFIPAEESVTATLDSSLYFDGLFDGNRDGDKTEAQKEKENILRDALRLPWDMRQLTVIKIVGMTLGTPTDTIEVKLSSGK